MRVFLVVVLLAAVSLPQAQSTLLEGSTKQELDIYKAQVRIVYTKLANECPSCLRSRRQIQEDHPLRLEVVKELYEKLLSMLITCRRQNSTLTTVTAEQTTPMTTKQTTPTTAKQTTATTTEQTTATTTEQTTPTTSEQTTATTTEQTTPTTTEQTTPTTTEQTTATTTEQMTPTTTEQTTPTTTQKTPTTTEKTTPTTTEQTTPSTTKQIILTTTQQTPATTELTIPNTTKQKTPTTATQKSPTTINWATSATKEHTTSTSTEQITPTTTNDANSATTEQTTPTSTEQITPATTNQITPTTTNQATPTTTEHTTPTTTEHTITTNPQPIECQQATNYTQSWRRDHLGSDIKPGGPNSNGGYACDFHISNSWFRFTGEAGNRMLDSCPMWQSCGAVIPYWTDAEMPKVVGVESTVDAYGVFGASCKYRTEQVKVMRCSRDTEHDFIYKQTADYAVGTTCSEAFCGMI